MKNTQFNMLLFVAGFFFWGAVQAHDPSLHTKKMEKPKCEAMKNMDHSKMGANDPVMMAMMQKCAGGDRSETHQAENTENNHMDNNMKKRVDHHKGGHNH